MATTHKRAYEEFVEVETRTIEGRNRVTFGSLLEGATRVRLSKNSSGEILVQPLVEIPARELWLYQNPEALKAVRVGLQAAAEGRVSELNLDEL